MPTKKQIITIGVLCVVALGLGYWSGPFEKDSGQRAEAVAPTIITNVVREVVTNIVAATPQPTPTPAPIKPQPTPPNIIPVNIADPIVEKGEIAPITIAPITYDVQDGTIFVPLQPPIEFTGADGVKVTRPSLSNKQLTEVPEGLEKFTQLKELSLSYNKLTNVKGLEKFAQLEVLILYKNQLTDVKGLEKLTKLKSLHLGNNQLSDVKGLEKLTQLKELILTNNKLTDVKGLEKLWQLTELHLSQNKLTDLKGLENLTRLKLLDVRFNPDLTKADIWELQRAVIGKCKILSNPKK